MVENFEINRSFVNEEKGDVKLESLINMKKEILNKKISNAIYADEIILKNSISITAK